MKSMRKLLYIFVFSALNSLNSMEGPYSSNTEEIHQADQEIRPIHIDIKPVSFRAPSINYIYSGPYQQLYKQLVETNKAVEGRASLIDFASIKALQTTLYNSAIAIRTQGELILQLQKMMEPLWALRELFKKDRETVKPIYEAPAGTQEDDPTPILALMNIYFDMSGKADSKSNSLRLYIINLLQSTNLEEISLAKGLAHNYFLSHIKNICFLIMQKIVETIFKESQIMQWDEALKLEGLVGEQLERARVEEALKVLESHTMKSIVDDFYQNDLGRTFMYSVNPNLLEFLSLCVHLAESFGIKENSGKLYLTKGQVNQLYDVIFETLKNYSLQYEPYVALFNYLRERISTNYSYLNSQLGNDALTVELPAPMPMIKPFNLANVPNALTESYATIGQLAKAEERLRQKKLEEEAALSFLPPQPKAKSKSKAKPKPKGKSASGAAPHAKPASCVTPSQAPSNDEESEGISSGSQRLRMPAPKPKSIQQSRGQVFAPLHYDERIQNWFDNEWINLQHPRPSARSIFYHTYNPYADHYIQEYGVREIINTSLGKVNQYHMLGRIERPGARPELVLFTLVCNSHNVCYHRGFEHRGKDVYQDILAKNYRFTFKEDEEYQKKEIITRNPKLLPEGNTLLDEGVSFVRISDPRHNATITLFKLPQFD